MRKTSRYVTALKPRVHFQSRVSHVNELLLVCRDLVGDHRKRKAAWSRVCINQRTAPGIAGVALETFTTLSDQKAVSKPPPTLLNSRLQSVIIFLLNHVALKNPERRFFLNS